MGTPREIKVIAEEVPGDEPIPFGDTDVDALLAPPAVTTDGVAINATGGMVPTSAGALTDIVPCDWLVGTTRPSPPHAARATATSTAERSAAWRWAVELGSLIETR